MNSRCDAGDERFEHRTAPVETLDDRSHADFRPTAQDTRISDYFVNRLKEEEMGTAQFVIRLCLPVLALIVALGNDEKAPTSNPQRLGSGPANEYDEELPMIALWRDDDGFGIWRPCRLLVAVWSDGQVIFAKDPMNPTSELSSGRIAPYRLKRLKSAISDTHVFDLKGYCYVGFDLPIDCIMINFGKEKRQMLYWLEGQTDWMRGNPNRMEFVECWTAIKNLALVACPDGVEPAKINVRRTRSWYLKPRIQSE